MISNVVFPVGRVIVIHLAYRKAMTSGEAYRLTGE